MNKFGTKRVVLKSRARLIEEGWREHEETRQFVATGRTCLKKDNLTITATQCAYLSSRIDVLEINVNEAYFTYNSYVWPIEVMCTEMEELEFQLRKEMYAAD